MGKTKNRWLANLAISIVAAGLCFTLIEGFASGVLLVRGLLDRSSDQPSVAERTHTRYDREIGWVNIPNTAVENLYGPGAHLRINGQGFRGLHDVSVSAPAGKRRIICSGDSFTLGYGVGDDETWCHQLAQLVPDVESVNMGQGGYGIDQAWLWYKRDGVPLEHDLHVFAFIYSDLARMTDLEFLHYGKPRVRITHGQLEIENVPVPQAGALHSWLRRHRDTFGALRLFRLLGPLVSHELPAPRVDTDYSHSEAVSVALEIFSDVERTNAKKGSVALFVYLPQLKDLGERRVELARFRSRFAQQMKRRSLAFIDLTPDFVSLSESDRAALFIQPGGKFRHAKGHYTPEGNTLVAQSLRDRVVPLLDHAR